MLKTIQCAASMGLEKKHSTIIAILEMVEGLTTAMNNT
jgi:hypothetical protein